MKKLFSKPGIKKAKTKLNAAGIFLFSVSEITWEKQEILK